MLKVILNLKHPNTLRHLDSNKILKSQISIYHLPRVQSPSTHAVHLTNQPNDQQSRISKRTAETKNN